MALTLYKWRKFFSDYRVHGTQIDWLGLTVPMQKSVLKNMYRKSVRNRPSKPNQQNLTHFGRYLRTWHIFFKTDFCVGILSPSRSIWILWTLLFEEKKSLINWSESFCWRYSRIERKSETLNTWIPPSNRKWNVILYAMPLTYYPYLIMPV